MFPYHSQFYSEKAAEVNWALCSWQTKREEKYPEWVNEKQQRWTERREQEGKSRCGSARSSPGINPGWDSDQDQMSEGEDKNRTNTLGRTVSPTAAPGTLQHTDSGARSTMAAFNTLLLPKLSWILTHVSSHHPESLWSVSPMIHYTQFVFTVGIYTHFSPRRTPTPQISQTLLYLNPPF